MRSQSIGADTKGAKLLVLGPGGLVTAQSLESTPNYI